MNRAYSAKAYRNCEFRVFANTNFGGNSFGWFLSATSLLNLNGDVESLKLRPV